MKKKEEIKEEIQEEIVEDIKEEIVEETKEEKPIDFSKAINENPFPSAWNKEQIQPSIARPSEIIESEEVKEMKWWKQAIKNFILEKINVKPESAKPVLKDKYGDALKMLV